VSQTRTRATSNADGVANADGERVKAPTLSAFGYLTRVAVLLIRHSDCSGTSWGSLVQSPGLRAPAKTPTRAGGASLLDVTRAGHGFRPLFSGLVLALLWWGTCIATSAVPLTATQGAAVRVPILVYHTVDESGNTYSITPRQLNQQCRWLVEQGYTTITLRQFWRAARGLTNLPSQPVILTNDDGDPSTRTFARILDRYGLVGTYFVNNVSPLTRRQIRALAQRGSVEAHTVSHIALSRLDYEDQVTEIAENRAYLEEITGQPVRFLAWPYGDVNESASEAAAAAGIVVAFGLGATAADLDTTDWYAIPRMTIFVDDDLETFAAKIRGE
jgi:peptidoglycan/xylan/chitin deacetylase (PgdA/CDA1 family)